MMNNEAISVVVAEDHRLYGQTLVQLLKNLNYHCIGIPRNGKELIRFLETHEAPDILLLDLSMPEIDGNECFNLIKKQYPQINVIILSQYNDPELIRNFFDRGIKAFIPKEHDINELSQALDEVSKGFTYTKNLPKSILTHHAVHEPFTPREIKVIKLIVEGKTNKEIASLLNVSIKTVEVDRIKIYEKANVKNLPEFMKFIYSSGWYYLDYE